MRVIAGAKYLIIFLFTLVFGILAGVGYRIFLTQSIIAPSQVIKNKTKLKEYLVAGGETLPIKSLSIIPQNTWKVTTNCIAESRGKERVFCLEEFVDNNKMVINIYPNAEQIALTEEEKVDRLLNLLIISVFEKHFSLEQETKNQILDHGSEGFIFKW